MYQTKVRKYTMDKNRYKYNRNVSTELPLELLNYSKMLYKKGCSDNTVTHYRCHINRLAEFNGVEPKDLTIDHFDEYISYVVFDMEYSSDYINQLISAAYLYYRKILKINFDKELYARRKKTNKIHHYLTYDQFVSIGMKLTDFRVKVIVWLCYDAGLRVQETLDLTLDCLDFKNKIIKIINSKNRKSRVVKMTDMIEKYLIKYLESYRKFERRHENNKYLFRGHDSKRPLYQSNIAQRFKTAVKAAGLDGLGISLHTLRHAYATMLYERGVALDRIQKILGHSSITTTMNYIVQSPSFLADLPSHLSPKVKK